MRVYDGENLKDTDPKAKSIQEYRDSAGVDEGMAGLSTRFAFKILSKVFNFDPHEVAPTRCTCSTSSNSRSSRNSSSRKPASATCASSGNTWAPRYVEFIGKEIQTAYLESYSEYGQNIFDRYVLYADFWIQDQEYRDPETGEILNRAALNEELEKIEKPAGISNPDFRNEIVNFVLRARAGNNGKNPSWLSYEKLRVVIEKKMFSNTEDLLPVISFNAKASKGGPAEAQRLRQTHGRARLHREAGPPAVGMVPAGSQVAVVCHRYGRCDRTGRRRTDLGASLRRGATGPEEHS